MKKTDLGYLLLTFILLFLTVLTIDFAEAAPIIKYYGNVDQKECNATIKNIPDVYYTKLKAIKVFERQNYAREGAYWPGQIELYHGCNKYILIHELAHHQQYLHKEKWYYILTHKGNFTRYEGLIEEANIHASP
jgi:hypothetical protein